MRSSGWPAGLSVRRAPSPPLGPPPWPAWASSSAAEAGGGIGPGAVLWEPPCRRGLRRREGSRATPGAAVSGTGETQPGPASLPGQVRRCRALLAGAGQPHSPCPAAPRPLLPTPPQARAAGGALRSRAGPGAHPPGARRLREAAAAQGSEGAARGAGRCASGGAARRYLAPCRGTLPRGPLPGSGLELRRTLSKSLRVP